MSDNLLEIKNVSKVFETSKKESVTALENVSLEVGKQEFICIVGSSGCGKSTLLRLILDLESITSGEILIAGEPASKAAGKIGMVFQEPRLLQWKSVEKNIDFAISRDVPKKERNRIIAENIKLVGLEDFKKSYPGQLSGGMQQRVGIARALSTNPEILLLDEPFGALDAFTKMTLQKEVKRIWHEEQNTMIMVTHDIDEAIFLSTKVVVMTPRPGRIKTVIPIELKEERNRSSYNFLEYRKKILAALFDEGDENVEYVI
jgi:ABC-type nitrate/sulfonate/bicarbonate transport system ATPase subunit